MDTRYQIKTATEAHIPELAHIERAAASMVPEADLPLAMRWDAVEPDLLRAAMKEGTLWVALEGAENPVGFAWVCAHDAFGHLAELDVHPDHGRRGIGAALVQTVLDWAMEHGKAGVTLTTFRHLPWNAPFYRRMGFEEVGGEAVPGYLQAHLMEEVEAGLEAEKRVAMWKRFQAPAHAEA